MDDNLNQSGYLAHHGIKGQKWGIRRFQNEDRSLTPEGKERYRSGGSKSGKTGRIVRKNSKNEKEVWKASDAEKLSDEELNRRNSRLQREQQYKNSVTSDRERALNDFKKQLVQKVLVATFIGAVAVLFRKKAAEPLVDKAYTLISKASKTAVNKIKKTDSFDYLFSEIGL